MLITLKCILAKYIVMIDHQSFFRLAFLVVEALSVSVLASEFLVIETQIIICRSC
jgi:hypothetical protein